MVAEFDDVAAWTADAVQGLGMSHAIPATCRGSANPLALAWLAEACELTPGQLLLDVGAGAGGPAAWAADHYGARPILIEPMRAACRAAVRVHGLPVLAAEGARLPLRSGSAGAAWCLGMLCTVQDKAAVLEEIHRVLRPGGSLGLLVVLSERGEPPRAPEGNSFPSRRDLAELLDSTGFQLVEQIRCPSRVPLSWSRRTAQVRARVAAQHRRERAFTLAADQGERFARLFAQDEIVTQLVHARARPRCSRRAVTTRAPGRSSVSEPVVRECRSTP
jgi:SAM-dependent methyltransferase